MPARNAPIIAAKPLNAAAAASPRQIAREIVSKKVGAEGLSIQGFEMMYNDKTKGLAKLLLVVFVALASLPLSIKLFKLGNVTWGNYLNDLSLTIIFVLTNLYFIFIAAKTFYIQRGKRRIVKEVNPT